MAIWKTIFDIQDIWGNRNSEVGPEAWSDKTIHELSKEVARRLRRKFPIASSGETDGADWELIDIIDGFDGVSTYPEWVMGIAEAEEHSPESAQVVRHYSPLCEFNEIMKGLYDWANGERVWINK